MCRTCDDLAAGLIDAVTADVCADAEDGVPYAPGHDFEEHL